VIAQAGNDAAPAVGVLTSDNRDHWTDARADFLAASPSGLNAASLKSIESAMVLVPLDDFSPVTREDASWATWVGNGRNRFYDKHQLIVYENGKSGFLGEHSCMDGTPTLRMNDFMLSALAAGKIDLSPARNSQTASDLPPPTELKFELDTKMHENIKAAEARFDALVAEHALEVLHYEGYGKALIKTFKASPDAWAQLVKQLAFHRMHGRPGVCYESAQTRKYRLGRTEVIRSASNESREWAEAMDDPKRSDGEREALFLRAVKRHLTYAGWAADGQGVDRHLFGLKKVHDLFEHLVHHIIRLTDPVCRCLRKANRPPRSTPTLHSHAPTTGS
jgi:carnitine O-acetyltransferase